MGPRWRPPIVGRCDPANAKHRPLPAVVAARTALGVPRLPGRERERESDACHVRGLAVLVDDHAEGGRVTSIASKVSPGC